MGRDGCEDERKRWRDVLRRKMEKGMEVVEDEGSITGG